MAEFQNWNLGGNILAGYERGRQIGRDDKFRALASQAVAANPAERDALLSQAVAVDPNAGFELGERLNKNQDRRQTQLYNMAKGWKQLHAQNPVAAQSFFTSQIAPGLKNIGFDLGGWGYNEQEVGSVVDQILAYDPSGADAEPAGFRQLDMAARAAGFEPGTDEYKNYFQVQGGIKGRAPSGGFNFELVPGVGYVRENPRSGTLEVYDPQTHTIQPIIGGADINSGQGGVTDPAGIPAPTVNLDGLTADQNQRLASFIAELSPEQADAAINAVNGRPRSVAAPPSASVPTPAAAPSPAAQRFGDITTRTPEQQAALTEAAKNAEALKLYDAQTARVGAREAAQAEGKAQGEARAQKAIALPQVLAAADETVSLLDQVLNHPGRSMATGKTSLNPLNRVPGTDAYDFGVLLDQIKGQAFLQAFQSLRGGGAITEREGQAATNAIARLNAAQSDEAFVAAIRDLKRIVNQGKNRAISGAAVPTESEPAPEDDALINKYLNP